ncbi:MAG: YeeE/YedE family protein [Nitrospirae bacterium]|nr:YeeE/YedE family protein [Nitrospirota bacterium]
MVLVYLVLGVAFGLVLSRSGAADYDYIQNMFLFRSFQLYGIIGTAVIVTAPGLWLLKRYGKTVRGEPLGIKPKPRHRGNLVGGILFGIGWSITGMCPGPIFVNMGEGKVYAIAALAGALVGTYLLGAAYPKLRAPLGLPPIEEGTGKG